MSARSRGVGEPVVRALVTVAMPRSITGTARCPPKGLPHWLIAMPQCAIAQSGIFLRDALEHLDRFGEPERMQQRDRVVEIVADRRRAGRVELDARTADLIRRHGAVLLVLCEGNGRRRATYTSR